MSDDLVKRLRKDVADLLEAGTIDPGLPDDGELMIEAANRIEELEAGVAFLTDAIENGDEITTGEKMK